MKVPSFERATTVAFSDRDGAFLVLSDTGAEISLLGNTGAAISLMLGTDRVDR